VAAVGEHAHRDCVYAVVVVAFGAGASTTFIVAIQSLRVTAMVLAPLAVRMMVSRG
jgi:uncharacterized membrane protein AbrB (regulator of aidB expression)